MLGHFQVGSFIVCENETWGILEYMRDRKIVWCVNAHNPNIQRGFLNPSFMNDYLWSLTDSQAALINAKTYNTKLKVQYRAIHRKVWTGIKNAPRP